MKEARKNRRSIVQQDVRQLGLLMVLAGGVGFFLDPGAPDAESMTVAAAGFGIWFGAVLLS